MRIIVALLGALLALPFVVPAAFACPVTLAAQDTDSFIAEIPSLNAALQSCPTTITPPGDRLVGEGSFQLDITRPDGTVRSVLVATANKEITGVSAGAGSARWTVTMSEETLDSILSSKNRGEATARSYGERKIGVRANSFFRAAGWFFVQPFVRRAVVKSVPPQAQGTPAAQGLTGKPENCEDTYLPGHRLYAQNKELWDSYSANADGVCQVNRGQPRGGNCVHSVQLSTDNGVPYYLCWYKA